MARAGVDRGVLGCDRSVGGVAVDVVLARGGVMPGCVAGVLDRGEVGGVAEHVGRSGVWGPAWHSGAAASSLEEAWRSSSGVRGGSIESRLRRLPRKLF
jgi:hypothetical protein